MGAKTPSMAAVPPEPETVKRVEADVVKARANAKTAAAQRFGISGTDATQGKLTDESLVVRKKKLGGD